MNAKAGMAIAMLLAGVAVVPCYAQDAVDGFQSRTFNAANGTTLRYRLFVPDAAVRVRALPLIVFLHGSGGSGTDNLKQISGGSRQGTHLWTTRQLQNRFPSFVVAPQIPTTIEWPAASDKVLELLTSLAGEFTIDADRVYLVGQSMGGYGAWDLITRHPQVFAAAIPLCGGGDVEKIAAARAVPVWAFHGARDETVPVERSREMVRALRAAGGTVKYTEYLDVGHVVWTRAFSEPTLPEWLFAQRRGRP